MIKNDNNIHEYYILLFFTRKCILHRVVKVKIRCSNFPKKLSMNQYKKLCPKLKKDIN